MCVYALVHYVGNHCSHRKLLFTFENVCLHTLVQSTRTLPGSSAAHAGGRVAVPHTTSEIIVYIANNYLLLRMCADSHAQWGLVQHIRVNQVATTACALGCAVLLYGTCMYVYVWCAVLLYCTCM
jgi:hypothetical protein